MYRRLYGQDRGNLEEIEKCVNEIFHILDLAMRQRETLNSSAEETLGKRREKERERLTLILQNRQLIQRSEQILVITKTGIKSLNQTYQNDPSVLARLRLMSDRIEDGSSRSSRA